MVRRRTAQADKPQTSKVKEGLSYLAYIALGVVLALVIRTWIICPVRVVGWSMEPTLYQGDIMLITPSSYKLHDVKRFDIIVLSRPNSEDVLLVKRVIALPGETVSIHDGSVYINGQLLAEDTFGAEPLQYDMQELTVPEGEVFVLGDNRNQSTDSHELGTIPIDTIRGRVLVTLFGKGNG